MNAKEDAPNVTPEIHSATNISRWYRVGLQRW